MRRFWTDKIALATAAVGVMLMILAMIWRINPVEGSVIPAFLTGNTPGTVVIYILLAACLPSWILAGLLTMLIPLPEGGQYAYAWGSMLIIQAMVYFMAGKLISFWVRRCLRRREFLQ